MQCSRKEKRMPLGVMTGASVLKSSLGEQHGKVAQVEPYVRCAQEQPSPQLSVFVAYALENSCGHFLDTRHPNDAV